MSGGESGAMVGQVWRCLVKSQEPRQVRCGDVEWRGRSHARSGVEMPGGESGAGVPGPCSVSRDLLGKPFMLGHTVPSSGNVAVSSAHTCIPCSFILAGETANVRNNLDFNSFISICVYECSVCSTCVPGVRRGRSIGSPP